MNLQSQVSQNEMIRYISESLLTQKVSAQRGKPLDPQSRKTLERDQKQVNAGSIGSTRFRRWNAGKKELTFIKNDKSKVESIRFTKSKITEIENGLSSRTTVQYLNFAALQTGRQLKRNVLTLSSNTTSISLSLRTGGRTFRPREGRLDSGVKNKKFTSPSVLNLDAGGPGFGPRDGSTR